MIAATRSTAGQRKPPAAGAAAFRCTAGRGVAGRRAQERRAQGRRAQGRHAPARCMPPADSGAFFIDALIAMMVLFALLLSFLTIPELLIKKQELDYIAKTAVRRIELDGMAGMNLRRALLELESETGISADVEWSGAFRGADAKLQIRDRFVLTARYTVRITLFEPSFTAPVHLDVPIRKTLSGVSEVYWKDLT